MRSRTLLVSLLFFAVIIAGCQTSDSEGKLIADAFIGGNAAMKINFIENSPPSEVTDTPEGETGFPFDASVTIENIGETDIEAEAISLKLSGFDPGDFDITDASELIQTYPPSGVFRGVSKDPDGNRIQGDIAQITFPKTPTQQLKYKNVLSAGQEFPFVAEICYPYSTKAISQVCLMSDFTSNRQAICNPTGSRPVSNSGSPIQVTSITQSVGGQHKLLLNFAIKKVGSSDLFKLSETDRCKDAFTNKDRVTVDVTTNIKGLKCLGLLGGTEAGEGAYRGEALLSGGSASFTCIQDYDGGTDSLKTFEVKLSYYARDSAKTEVLVKHLI